VEPIVDVNDGDNGDTPPPLTPRQSTSSDEDRDDNEDEYDDEIPDDEVYHPDTMTSSVHSTYGLRPRRAREYIHTHANIVYHAMTQYSLNKGLKKLRKEGEKTI
jgi:hypothetical protein